VEINCGGNMAGWLSQLFEMGVVLEDMIINIVKTFGMNFKF
jgi:hypothetical protein